MTDGFPTFQSQRRIRNLCDLHIWVQMQPADKRMFSASESGVDEPPGVIAAIDPASDDRYSQVSIRIMRGVRPAANVGLAGDESAWPAAAAHAESRPDVALVLAVDF